MKKILLLPDSFKGTLGSIEICNIMEECIAKHFPQCRVVSIPVADGGEGSVDCFLKALGGEKVYKNVKGVFGEACEGYYAMLPDGRTAVIEMACCAGLPAAEGRLNPKTSTTYGVGELMLAAAKSGATHIIMGLGGSATNDGGCGAAAAAGIRFSDAGGREFVPTGGTLGDICKIDASGLDASLKAVKITAMCDIDNPMFGETGAAYIFAPQKGADMAMVRELDAGLVHLNEMFMQDLQMDLSGLPGGGAAGAMGAGMQAFFGASLQMGIDTVLDTIGFDNELTDADLIFTGEGRIDSQSLRGKVVMGIARRARAKNVPVVAIVGAIGEGVEPAYDDGITAIFSINTKAMDFSQSRKYTAQNLTTTIDNLLRFAKQCLKM